MRWTRTTLAIALLVAACALITGCGGKATELIVRTTTSAAGAPESVTAGVGFPVLATKNTTRVSGSDSTANAAGVALAVYPSTVAGTHPTVRPEEVEVSYWSYQYLGSGNGIAADAGIYPVLIGYGDQDPYQVITYLYNTPTWTKQLANEANGQQVQYVETDTRLTKSLPPAGAYFPNDSAQATEKIAPAALTKYNNITGVAHVFSDGTINFYDLVSQGYVPQKP